MCGVLELLFLLSIAGRVCKYFSFTICQMGSNKSYAQGLLGTGTLRGNPR